MCRGRRAHVIENRGGLRAAAFHALDVGVELSVATPRTSARGEADNAYNAFVQCQSVEVRFISRLNDCSSSKCEKPRVCKIRRRCYCRLVRSDRDGTPHTHAISIGARTKSLRRNIARPIATNTDARLWVSSAACLCPAITAIDHRARSQPVLGQECAGDRPAPRMAADSADGFRAGGRPMPGVWLARSRSSPWPLLP